MKHYTPPIYMHTTGLAAPAATAIERSAAAGGHEVRAHVQSWLTNYIADNSAMPLTAGEVRLMLAPLMVPR